MRRGRYYLARVIKLGQLNQLKLLDAIAQAPIVEIGQSEWTITDVIDRRDAPSPFIFGNLAKYSRNGEVTIVNESAKQQHQAHAPYLLEASAPFVYLPDFSGLAFLHVWNGIQEEIFPRRFKAIIEAAYDNFFVGCTVEPVADYRAFLEKLQSLDIINELSAKVHPPNPLFGRLWGGLDKYVRRRQADEVSVREITSKSNGLSTQLLELIEQILKNPSYEPAEEPDITDAALLMAADGYGSGKAVGTENGHDVVIRTSESQKSFLFDKKPDPELLALLARGHFESVSSERDMRH
ncbi:hypothetical protein [Pseudomonas laurylsulfatiphila]|uniref:hypothetical protein n=1 Tax=Pseudomonas laurylsulfatiphila TaxID=2011015 RepID=UPI00215F56BD|nr:hypothetical protein [Pseudomonas laurylsulfatiphila]UVM06043.1 hypothetical protein LOY25_04890 [Pseudomonas laurylsulfatiphila]